MGLTWQQLIDTRSRDNLINICKHKLEMADLHLSYVNRHCLKDVDYVYQRDTAWGRYNMWHDRLKDLQSIKEEEEQ